MFGHQINPYFSQARQFGFQSREFYKTIKNSRNYPMTMNPSIHIQNGFIFSRKTEKIDWRKLASIDVDYIVRNVDFEALQDILLNITFCNIESEFVNDYIDPNFIKLFKLSQLIIEYLLQSQEYIFSNVHEISQELAKEKEMNLRLKTEDIVKLENQIVEMKKELHNRRHIIAMQQQIIQNGRESVNKCSFCPKTFISQQLLQSHIFRRHADLQSLDFEQNEILVEKKLSSKLVDDEKNKRLEKIQEEWQKQFQLNLKELSDRLRRAEEQNESILARREEKTKFNEKNDFDINKQLDALKDEQKKIYESELKRMQSSFMKELKDMNEKQLKLTDELDMLKQTRIGGSMIGNLEDDEEGNLVEKRKREMSSLKNQFNKDIREMQSKLEKQLEKKYNEKMRQLEEANKLKIKKLINEAEEQKKILQLYKKSESDKIIEDIEIFENSVVHMESENGIHDQDIIDMNTNQRLMQSTIMTEDNDDDETDDDKNIKILKEKIPKSKTNKSKVKNIQQSSLSEPKPPIRTKKKQSKISAEKKFVFSPLEKGKSTPELLALAKAELEMRLESIRVPKNATQLPDAHYSSITNLLSSHKTDLKQKYPDFDALRAKCNKVLNLNSKNFIDQVLSKKSDKVNTKQVNFSSTLPPRVPSQSANKQLESSTKAKAISLQDLNQPSMEPQRPTALSRSSTFQQADSYNDHASDDENNYDEDNESEVDDASEASVNEEEDDSISNIDMNLKSKNKKVEFNESKSDLNLSVKEKTKLIENQLQNRSSKKPFGAIDALTSIKVIKSDTKKASDDDAFSLTDISVQEPDKPLPKPRISVNIKSSINSNQRFGSNSKLEDAGSWDESD